MFIATSIFLAVFVPVASSFQYNHHNQQPRQPDRAAAIARDIENDLRRLNVRQENLAKDVVVKFELNGVHFCSGSGATIIESAHSRYTVVFTPMECWQEIQSHTNVIARTARGQQIEFQRDPTFYGNVVQLLASGANWRPIRIAGSEDFATFITGNVAIWHDNQPFPQATLALKDDRCDIPADDNPYFCSGFQSPTQNTAIQLGTPFVFIMNEEYYLAGIHMAYDSNTHYNLYGDLGHLG